jgi:hypothetical protein
MAKLIHRAAALLGCSLILAFVTASGSGSAAELTEGAASASAATTPAASAPSDSPNPQRMCQGDPKCPMGFIVWESAPFSRV